MSESPDPTQEPADPETTEDDGEDQDSGPSGTAEQVDVDEQRDQAEG
jgi:hypothetical protein